MSKITAHYAYDHLERRAMITNQRHYIATDIATDIATVLANRRRSQWVNPTLLLAVAATEWLLSCNMPTLLKLTQIAVLGITG